MVHLRGCFKDVGDGKDAVYTIKRIDNLYHNDHKHRVGEKGRELPNHFFLSTEFFISTATTLTFCSERR